MGEKDTTFGVAGLDSLWRLLMVQLWFVMPTQPCQLCLYGLEAQACQTGESAPLILWQV